MKRLRIILIFLLLGAVVNVAVAWGLAAWPQTDVEKWDSMTDIVETYGVESWGDEPRIIPRSVYRANERRVPPALAGSFQMFGGIHRFGVDTYYIDTRTNRHHVCLTHAVLIGWPRRSLWGHHTYYVRDPIGTNPGASEDWESGILLVIYENNQWIPYLPHWPGFAINTIVFGGLLWLIFVGRPMMIRQIRVWRGQCPQCAYDLRGVDHEACPECGSAIEKAKLA